MGSGHHRNAKNLKTSITRNSPFSKHGNERETKIYDGERSFQMKPFYTMNEKKTKIEEFAKLAEYMV
jgi:hypothetical protein